jgi:hypothetical protein
MGLAPSGFTTGKIALTMRKILLRISDTLRLTGMQALILHLKDAF